MDESDTDEYLAECFWPGVNETDLAALDQRAQAAALELSREGGEVRYRGSLLVRQDEVVLCCFEGSESSVRGVADRAQIPFDRILVAARSPWPRHSSPEHDRPEGTNDENDENDEINDRTAH